MKPIEAIKTAAPYVGGKNKLAGEICKIIDGIDHKVYAEPFVGMGGIFFKRKMRPSTEVINDRSSDISNFFRVVQRHYPQFIDFVKYKITSREEFERLKKCNPETLTDFEKAERFLYLQKISFGGKVTGRNFGVQLLNGARFDVQKIEPVLEAIHKRLSGTVIENLNWPDFLKAYDSKQTLFYCDPPYFGSENYYGEGLFDRFQYNMMAAHFKKLHGKFILSINDTPEIRKVFADFKLTETSLNYSIACEGATPAKELIITNF